MNNRLVIKKELDIVITELEEALTRGDMGVVGVVVGKLQTLREDIIDLMLGD